MPEKENENQLLSPVLGIISSSDKNLASKKDKKMER
jgi:hypothetical protein